MQTTITHARRKTDFDIGSSSDESGRKCRLNFLGQQCATSSTTELEYVARGDKVNGSFCRPVLSFIHPEQGGKPMLVYGRNKEVNQLTTNHLCSAHSTHIDMRHNFLREKVV